LKILIIRFSSIGDIILTTPIIRCVKNQTQAEVHYLSKKSFAGILEPNPYIDKCHFIHHKIAEVIPALQAEKFDFIIDLHHNYRTWQVKRALNRPGAAFPKLNLQKWILVNFKINLMPPLHVVDRYFEAAQPLGVSNDNQGLDYFYPASAAEPLSAIAPPFDKDFIAFVIGGQHEGKMCSKEKIARICAAIAHPIVLFGGPEDREKGHAIAQEAGPHVHNAAGAYPLATSAAYLQKARLVVTHDTGLMHMASAFHKDIISLWGGTVPELGFAPYMPGPHSIILEHKHFMRPTSKLGKRQGIYKLWDFMEAIPDTVIIAAIRERIGL